MYNGLLRFNKHILNELAEGLKHLPNLEGASKGDSLYINEDGNPTWGSSAFIPTFENAAYGILLNLILDLVLILFLIKLELIKKLTIIGKEVMMDKIQIKLFVCCWLAVTLVTVLRLALVSFILIGFCQVLMLMSASLPQLNLIK